MAGRVMGLVLGVGWLGFVFGWVVGCLVVGSGSVVRCCVLGCWVSGSREPCLSRKPGGAVRAPGNVGDKRVKRKRGGRSAAAVAARIERSGVASRA